MDAYIEHGAGMTVAELFETFGEERFRDLETKACLTLAAKQGQIIATGGGVVLRPENMEVLRETGMVVFLDRPPEQIIAEWRRPASLLKRGAENSGIYDPGSVCNRSTATDP
jgi:shikimate kinase